MQLNSNHRFSNCQVECEASDRLYIYVCNVNCTKIKISIYMIGTPAQGVCPSLLPAKPSVFSCMYPSTV